MHWLENDEKRRTWLLSGCCALLLCIRLPQNILHADLWGDDGWTFYPDAYYKGMHCLISPVNGYLNTVQRLGSLLAVWAHIPLLWLPSFFAFIGLGVQLAVAVFLISDRLEPLWKSWRSRTAFAILYILLPNTLETYGNLTNSQWHLEILAFLIVVSPTGLSVLGRVVDGLVLLVSGLSGPFCLLWVPFCLTSFRRYGGSPSANRELFTRSILVGVGCLVQTAFLLHVHSVRHLPLGASPMLLARIVSFRIVMGLLFGMRAIAFLQRMAWWQSPWPSLLIALATACVMTVAFLRGNYLFRSFSAFAVLLLGMELASPIVTIGKPQWSELSVLAFGGQRYFLVPTVALLAAFFILAARRSRIERFTGTIAIALILCYGIPLDWFSEHTQATNYDLQARIFDAAPAGTRVVFPEHPTGTMVLIKKAY